MPKSVTVMSSKTPMPKHSRTYSAIASSSRRQELEHRMTPEHQEFHELEAAFRYPVVVMMEALDKSFSFQSPILFGGFIIRAHQREVTQNSDSFAAAATRRPTSTSLHLLTI